jgi:hypothetical protein
MANGGTRVRFGASCADPIGDERLQDCKTAKPPQIGTISTEAFGVALSPRRLVAEIYEQNAIENAIENAAIRFGTLREDRFRDPRLRSDRKLVLGND